MRSLSEPFARLRPAVGRMLERAVRSGRLPFEVRARLYWRKQQGTWIARRPEDFIGKLRWKLLKDRRRLQVTFADRVAVRDYVARVAGPEFLTACYAIAADPAEIDRSALPREWVAKASHASGGIWIVTDRAPAELTIVESPEARGPRWAGSGWNLVLSRPETLDWELFVKSSRAWLSRNYSRRHYVEWPYLHVPPRMIVEELLRADDAIVPVDYKFFVFNGRPRLIHVAGARFRAYTSNLYLPDWTPVDADWPDGDTIVPRGPLEPPPDSLERMLELAAELAQDIDFVRVDLYDVGGRVVFGELTNTPTAAIAPFVPRSFDLEVGSWWTQPSSYRAVRSR